jgi:signal transduction histidine kinase
MTLFETLERLVARIDPACVLAIRGSSITFLPAEVASALSDAAIQALNNSLQHAGSKASRSIHMRSTRNGVKLVISDNGIGFRPSKVPAHSLGLRFVIIRQVESVGGRVHIDSHPRQGTKVVLEWETEK